MKLRTVALSAVVIALAVPTFGSVMKAGKWQVTVEMSMPNMPEKVPPTTFTHCVTKEEAEHPQLNSKMTDQGCDVTDYNMSGNTVTWKVKCTGKTKLTGEGRMVFSGDSYEGTTHLKTDQMEFDQKFTGKYLGACDKE